MPETNETQKRLFDDAMYKIEHGVSDESKAGDAKPRLVNLFNRNESTWADDYRANSQLRATFRVSGMKAVKGTLDIVTRQTFWI